MSNDSTGSARNRFLATPHHIALAIVWIVTAGAVMVMLSRGVRLTDQHQIVRWLLQVAYVTALLWYLSLTGPATSRLPEVRQQLPPRWEFTAWIPPVLIGLVLMLTMVSDDGDDIFMLLIIASTVWLLVVWWRQIRLVPVLQGLGLAAMAYVAILPAFANGFVSETILYLLPGMVPPMYVAGGILVRRTELGGVQLLDGKYSEAIRSFLHGCVLFIPLGLLNAADGSPGGDTSWVNQWWMPISLPWFSGIAEEVWFRLLVVGLVYFLLRPVFRDEPATAVVLTVLFCGITFGLIHGRNVGRFLTTGLLYGVPLAALFARRDLEHAVGAHYMINMFPWAAAFLES